MKYILGIDIGTSHTKAIAYGLDGEVLAQSNEGYQLISPQEGWQELDPLALFNAAIKVIGEVVAGLGNDGLTGVCFSAAMHGLIAMDQHDEPLTNMITWADLRSTEYAQRLRSSQLGQQIYDRTGVPIHPMLPLCKLMWMKDHRPAIFAGAKKFISIKEFICYKLFGEYVVDHSIASATGLFDLYTLDWNAEALQQAGITADRLSNPVPTAFIFKNLKPEKALLMGISAGTAFVIGASDGCLAHLGSNALFRGDVSLTIGTSGAVRMMTEKPVQDRLQRVFSYPLDENVFISGGPINNGGNVLQWFASGFLQKSFTSGEDFDAFIGEAMTAPPGCGGLIFLPYLFGERAPVWDADARGLFFGVRSVHTRVHFMRSLMEGISYSLLEILQALESIIGPAGHIYVSGGFIASDAWVGLLADVLGRKLSVLHAEDASAVGAAILGMKALGMIGDLGDVQRFFSVTKEYEPDESRHEVYLKNFVIFRQLYEKMKGL